MLCLAHRQLGLPDLVHRSSSPWSARLVRRPLGQRPGSGQGRPAAWGGHKRYQKTTSALSRQINVFISLSSPPLPPQTYPQTQSTAWFATKQRRDIGKGGRRGPSCSRNLSSFLGAVCSVSQHLHEQFPELKLPGVLILLRLCICALKVPSKWILIVGAACCWLLQCPGAPRTCFSKP